MADVSVTISRSRVTPGEPPRAAGDGRPGRPAVVLALGSNLGDRLANLRRAVGLLCADGQLGCVAVSGVYETDPVGGPPQDDYLNAVLLAVSALPGRRDPAPRPGRRGRAGTGSGSSGGGRGRSTWT